ncbi:MAG: hypothetical protein AAFR59_18855, partial [Bacteroidota bacterium]
HAVSCTAWFVVIVLQAHWVQRGKIVRHARLGTYFSLLAPIIFLSGIWVLGHATQLYHESFAPFIPGAEISEERGFRALIIVGDLLQLLLFLGFVYLGYQYRSDIQVHKRAMLIASILICQQALVRLGKMEWLMIGEKPGASGGLYATIVPFLLLLSMLVYDLVSRKSIHRTTWLGIISYILFVTTALVLGILGLAVWGVESLRA